MQQSFRPRHLGFQREHRGTDSSWKMCLWGLFMATRVEFSVWAWPGAQHHPGTGSVMTQKPCQLMAREAGSGSGLPWAFPVCAENIPACLLPTPLQLPSRLWGCQQDSRLVPLSAATHQTYFTYLGLKPPRFSGMSRWGAHPASKGTSSQGCSKPVAETELP